MHKKFLHPGILFLVLIALWAFPAFAGVPTEKIRETTDEIIKIVSDPALKDPSRSEERRGLIRKAVDKRFDWNEMARRSMARHWNKRTEAEKKEFIYLFGELLEMTYLKKVEGYSGEKVDYEGETIDGEYGVVKVKILTAKNEPVAVEYRLQQKNGDWLVYDISIAGVSLVNNYRVQFNSILARSPYESLVKRLKEKISQE